MLLKNGKIFTMEGSAIDKGNILIEDKRIKKIIEGDIDIIHEKAIDLQGAWVFPGFIDAHTHLGIHEENMGFEGNDTNESTEPVTPHLRAIDAINPMDGCFKKAIRAGVTTVLTGPGSANVVGGTFAAIKTYGNVIDDMIVKETVGLKVALGENPKRVYNGKGKMPMTRMGTAGLLREVLTKGKNYMTKKEIALEKGEFFETDIRLEALIPVLRGDIPLKAHAHRADDIMTALRIAKEFKVNITLDHCTEGHLIPEKIKESGAPALLGPAMHFNSKIELTNRTFKTARILSETGVKFAIITDHPVVEIQYLPISAGLCVQAGLKEEEAFKAITIYPAEIAGIENRVGSIKEGKDADIAIFDGNPLHNTSKVLYTIINGKIVYDYSKDNE